MKKAFPYFLTITFSAILWIFLFFCTDQIATHFPTIRNVKNSLVHIYKDLELLLTNREYVAIEDPIPRIPNRISAVVGEPLSIYYSNLVLSKDPDKFRVEISSDTLHGSSERRRWTLVPSDLDKGTHSLLISVKNWFKETLETKTIEVCVVSPPPPTHDLSLLLVGNSITRQNLYPNLLYQKLNAWSAGKIHFVGSRQTTTLEEFNYQYPLPEVYHEGYRKWSWGNFLACDNVSDEVEPHLKKGPFVFKDNERLSFSVERYLEEKNLQNEIDYLIFFLGINNTFLLDPDDTDLVDHEINTAFKSADTLISAFEKTTPSTKIGIVLPPPLTSSEKTFYKTYQTYDPGCTDPWRSRRIQHNLVLRMIRHFENTHPSITLIPVNASYDTIDGYSIHDAGHPNKVGGEQIANAIYSYILSETEKNAPH